MIRLKLSFFLCLVLSNFFSNAQSGTNKFRQFIGVGNNNTIADIISLADKSFLGEISGQIRYGLRLYDNYELNLGAYFRQFPGIKANSDLSYNYFMGYSAGLAYEFRKPDSKWGVPFGVEVFSYNKNLDSMLSDGSKYYDHYKAISFGPKLGLRYHFSKNFFIEAEANVLYEYYKWDVYWVEKSVTNAQTFFPFKFIGISTNLSF